MIEKVRKEKTKIDLGLHALENYLFTTLFLGTLPLLIRGPSAAMHQSLATSRPFLWHLCRGPPGLPAHVAATPGCRRLSSQASALAGL